MREIEASSAWAHLSAIPAVPQSWLEAYSQSRPFFRTLFRDSRRRHLKEKPLDLVGYRYPIIATYSGTSADEVYALVKAIDKSMDLIEKNLTSSAANWNPSISGKPPADAPWHEGSISLPEGEGNLDRRTSGLAGCSPGPSQKGSGGLGGIARSSWKGQGDEAWAKFWEEYRVKTLGFPASSEG